MAKYLLFSGAVILLWVGVPFLLYGVSETATAQGISMVAADKAGTALAVLLIGALGMLYRPNRFAGFVVGTLVAASLMIAGARAQTACQFSGQNVRICGLSESWQPSVPQPHASAEFSRRDGFHAQLIIDAAGAAQGLTLTAAADTIVNHMRSTVGEENFDLLVRGVNEGIRDSEILVYQARINGIPFIYANTVYVGRSETIQLVTWRISQELSADDRSAHLEVGRSLVLMPAF